MAFGPHDYRWVNSEQHCQLGTEIGSGTTATVYKAVHPTTGQHIAIKKMDRALLQRNDQALHSFQREVDMFCRLNHPGIIRLLGVQMEPACHLIIMEHAECELAAEMEDGPMPEPTCRFYFRQIVRSVGYCHSQGICHRDLKLENVLLMKDCATVKVADFGMGKNYQMNSGPKTHEIGSFAYMSPEVVGGRGEYQPTPADVWSMGVMLYAMAICQYPFGYKTPGPGGAERSLQEEQRIRQAIMSADQVTAQHAFFPEVSAPPGAPAQPLSAGIQDLMRKILVVDPTRRATIAEILEHSWLVDMTGEEEYWQMMTAQGSQYPTGSPPMVDPAAVAAMTAHANRHVGAAGSAPMAVPPASMAIPAAAGVAAELPMALPMASPPIGAASGGAVGPEGYGAHLPTCSLESQGSATVEMMGEGTPTVTAEDMADEGWVGAQYDWAAAPVYQPQDSAGSFDMQDGVDFFDQEDDDHGF